MVKKEAFKIEVTVDGIFEAARMTEISIEPKAWTTLTLLNAVEHGTTVKRGDLLIALDLEKIDRAIGDSKKELAAADLTLTLSEQQLKTLEKTTPMNLAAAERSHKQAHDDYDYFLKVERPMAKKSNEFSLKSAHQSFENAQEELRQLEKMYKADDLTEETEEIILKRARASFERAGFYLEQAKLSHKRTAEVTFPRRDVSMAEAIRRQDLAYATGKLALTAALKKARADFEKEKTTRDRSVEKLEQMIADRAAMTVKAPTAGIVYYGKATRGKFTAGSSLRPGSSVTAKSVVMTVVSPRPMAVRASIAEKDLQNVRSGIKGTALPTGYSDMKLLAIVDRVGAVPMSGGSFDCRINVVLDHRTEALMPGMTCKVKFVAYEKQNALTIPPAMLKTDDDPAKQFVWRLDKQGKARKVVVRVGRSTSSKVEILKGLSEGDQVVAEPPKK